MPVAPTLDPASNETIGRHGAAAVVAGFLSLFPHLPSRHTAQLGRRQSGAVGFVRQVVENLLNQLMPDAVRFFSPCAAGML